MEEEKIVCALCEEEITPTQIKGYDEFHFFHLECITRRISDS